MTCRVYQQGDDVTETVLTNSVNENEATESAEKGVDDNDDSLRGEEKSSKLLYFSYLRRLYVDGINSLGPWQNKKTRFCFMAEAYFASGNNVSCMAKLGNI